MPKKYIPKTDKRLSDETKAKIAAKLREVNGTPEARAAIKARTVNHNARVKAALVLLAEQEANGG